MKKILTVLLCLLPSLAFAQMTPAQLFGFGTAIRANAEVAQLVADNDFNGIAAYYNAAASPDFWIWRNSATRSEIYHTTSHTGSTWSWQLYKGQSATEQNAWTQMFMGDTGNCSLANFRAGIGNIFTGSAQQNAQRDHCLAICKKKASRVEKLFAVTDPLVIPGAGNGAEATPANAVFSGTINFAVVGEALNMTAN